MSRKSFLFVIFVTVVKMSFAQTVDTDSLSIDEVYNICVEMQEALKSNDSISLVEAERKMEEQETVSFRSLRNLDETSDSIDNHYLFGVINQAPQRGQTADGSILTKTCFVKAGGRAKYSFSSRGHQELGIVTEPGGLVATKIHVTNSSGLDEWHNDNKNAKKGASRFRTAFELPNDKRNTVELEVVNRSSKDISFVVISN